MYWEREIKADFEWKQLSIFLIYPKYVLNIEEDKIEIDIKNICNELNECVERIVKTANEIYDDIDYNRIKLKTSDNG